MLPKVIPDRCQGLLLYYLEDFFGPSSWDIFLGDRQGFQGPDNSLIQDDANKTPSSTSRIIDGIRTLSMVLTNYEWTAVRKGMSA
jgi:hypothetical protein